MDCRRIGPLLMGLVDGELRPGERGSVERHLRTCPTCRREAASFERLARITESIELGIPTERQWRNHFRRIYVRLARGGGALLVVGAVGLALGSTMGLTAA